MDEEEREALDMTRETLLELAARGEPALLAHPPRIEDCRVVFSEGFLVTARNVRVNGNWLEGAAT